MKIIKDFKNELLNRREISAVESAEKTPSFADSLKIISEHFKEDAEKIVIHKIKGKFGKGTFLINASIYDSKELKEKIEPKKKEKKSGEEEKPTEKK